MNKKLLVASCLVAFGVFSGFEVANANENSTLENKASLRATPSIREATLRPGQSIGIDVGGFNSDYLASKYVLKVQVDSKDNEMFVITRAANYGPGGLFNSYPYHDKQATLHFTNLINTLPNDNRRTMENFAVTNYSAVPLVFKFGISSGIHDKSKECVDYSDIDFNL